MGPILSRLATAKQMIGVGPGFQNLVDLIREKNYTGTLRDLVGVEGALRGTFANRDAPIYRLTRLWWIGIFDHGMRADPSGGMMHTLDSLVEYVIQCGYAAQANCTEH